MRYQPDEAVIPKPPTPKRRDTSGVAPPPRRKTAEPTRTSGKKPSKPIKKSAATEHEEVVKEIVSDMTPEQVAEMERDVARTSSWDWTSALPGETDTPAGKSVSTDEAAKRTLPSPALRNLGL